MRDIPLSDQAIMPWKNGLGSTRQIFAAPLNGKFDWRVSLATVKTDGAFSIFENYERHIMVLEGAGMDLQFANGLTTSLNPLVPYTFSGDEPVDGILPHGSVTDFNLMVDRHYGKGKLTVLQPQLARRFICNADHCLIYLLDGPEQNTAKLLTKNEPCDLDAGAKTVVCEIWR